MAEPEITLNLWYIHDDMGFIYSLRVRLYVGIGTDEEKLAYLKQHAVRDYLIAKPFPIPKRFYINQKTIFRDGTLPRTTIIEVFHHSGFQMLHSPIALFEDAIKEMESELPSQTRLSIPDSPLFCVTPLFGDDDGNIVPKFDDQQRYK